MQSENLDLAFQTGESVGIPDTLVRPTFKLTGLTTGNFTCILLVLTRHHEHGTQLLGTYGKELDLTKMYGVTNVCISDWGLA